MRAGLILRDLRGGSRALWVVIAALVLGVAAMAALGATDRAVRAALADQGAEILGGQIEATFSHRPATAAERAAIAAMGQVSGVIRMRSMVSHDGTRALAELRAVDGAWPLLGQPRFTPDLSAQQVLAGRDGRPGAAMAADLAARLGIAPGDHFDLAGQDLVLMALIDRLPDGLGGSVAFAPVVLAPFAVGEALAQPGAFYETAFRLNPDDNRPLAAVRADLERALPEGTRLRDARRAVPGADRFLDRIGSFLMLASITGLALGGVGIALAISDWLARKAPEIATWRALGAGRGQLLALIGGQVAVVAAIGIAGGLALAALVLVIAGPLIQPLIPVALDLRVDAAAFARAAGIGALVAGLAALAPLGRLARMRAAAIWRGAALPAPGVAVIAALVIGCLALAGLVVAASPAPQMAAAVVAVMAAVGAAVWLAARLAQAALARLPRPGPAPLRLALAALAARRGGLTALAAALGVGLTLMAASGMMQANLARAITADIPDRAPAFFVIDIQPDQTGPVLDRLTALPGVTEVQSAPMLRGAIATINDRPAREVAPDSWVTRGDRGLSFAATPPEGTRLVAGRWWAADHSGPPEVSFSADEAADLGLKLGDRLGITVLGREVEVTITSLRAVDFRSAGIGFVMILSPNALAGAPHTTIATVRAESGSDAAIPAALADWPNVSAIAVREVAGRLAEGLGLFATIARIGGGLVLAAGLVVLAGTAASGAPARAREAAIARALGATARQIRQAALIRLGLAGVVAGLIAAGFGTLMAWGMMTFVLDLRFQMPVLVLGAILISGVAVMIALGLAMGHGGRHARPARLLRGD
ncbi:ABC transporter permease [Paracoccus sp. p4-l81]|uniref:ABC transporter permease n=1 Tax=Paracoccus sp. p4-l81 TaxID=3342806 RepID=UPI0035BB764F